MTAPLRRVPTLDMDEDSVELDPLADVPTLPVKHVLAGVAPKPPGMLVDGLLVARDINTISGFGGHGKTVAALTAAICVVLGRDVFGTLRVRVSGAVLLITPEDGEAQVRAVLEAIIVGMGLTAADRALLVERLIIVPDEELIVLHRDAAKIGATALRYGAVLVICDPLRNLIGDAEEASNDYATMCCDALRRHVCRAGRAAVLLLHHNRKQGKEAGIDAAPSIHDMRGAGGWGNSSRMVFSVAKKGDRVTLAVTKANRVRADLRHELTLSITANPTDPALWSSCTLTDANAGATSDSYTPGVGRDLNANERAALVCLDDRHEPGRRLSWSRWRDESGLNGNTFRSVKARLLDAGLAKALPTGKRTRSGSPEYAYEITPEGRKALSFGWDSVPPSGEGVSKGE